jgi:uncharacterized protein YwlG (UPF0340 family)
MVKAGGALRRRRAAQAFPGVEAEMVVVAAGRDEGGTGAGGRDLKTQHAAIEIERPLQIGDLQVDMANPHPGIDGGQAQGVFGHFGGFGHMGHS